MATATAAAPRQTSLDTILRSLIGGLLLVFVWVIYDGVREKLVVVGDSAPDFTITTDAGRSIGRSDFGGKLLVLNFWATWCPPCLEELPSLERFQRTLRDKGVVVLAISVDKDEKKYRDFMSKVKVSFTTARDPANEINAEYGTLIFPETYIIDTNGKVLRKLINSQDWMSPQILNDVQSLL